MTGLHTEGGRTLAPRPSGLSADLNNELLLTPIERGLGRFPFLTREELAKAVRELALSGAPELITSAVTGLSVELIRRILAQRADTAS